MVSYYCLETKGLLSKYVPSKGQPNEAISRVQDVRNGKKKERNYICIYFYCKSRIKDSVEIGNHV